MTENKTNQQKDKETLQAYAGVGVMFAMLIILFFLTTPGVMGNDDNDNLEEVDTESTQVVQVIVEETESSVEETEVAVETEVVIEETEAPENSTASDENDSNSGATYDPEIVALGETLFVTCAACHGVDGTGIEGLGKDLINGEFVLTATDEEVANVIINGRPIWDAANTTMIDMPPRGGNPTLTDEDVFAIVAYLRTLGADNNTNDAADESTEDNTDEATNDSNSDTTDDSSAAYDAESIANGEILFVTCSACHGLDGTGIAGLGKDLVNGEFTLTATDEEVANVIINGRPIWDAANTTMIDMPPRGGNPTLTDEDVDDIIAYIRSLQSP